MFRQTKSNFFLCFLACLLALLMVQESRADAAVNEEKALLEAPEMTPEKRFARFAFAKRRAFAFAKRAGGFDASDFGGRAFAFAKRAVADEPLELEQLGAEKRFAFADGGARRFAFAKREWPMYRQFAFAR